MIGAICLFAPLNAARAAVPISAVRTSYVCFTAFVAFHLFLAAKFAGALRFLGKPYFDCGAESDASNCFAVSVIVRGAFALALLYAFLLFCMFARDGFAKAVNESGLLFKYIFALALFALLLNVPNWVLQPFAQFAALCGVFCLFLQSIALVDFCCFWSEFWCDKYENGNCFYGFLLIAATIALNAIFAVLLFVGFRVFWISDCVFNKFFLLFNAVFPLIAFGGVLAKFNERSSALSASAIAALSLYQSLDALASRGERCGGDWPLSRSTRLAINAALCLAAAVRLSLASAASNALHASKIGYGELAAPPSDGRALYLGDSFVVFHAFMALVALCLIPLFFDWRFVRLVGRVAAFEGAPGAAAVWPKSVGALALMGMFGWTLVAPRVLPEREF